MLKKLFDHLSSHVTVWTWAWPFLAGVIGAGALSGYIAHATDWIRPWGPIAWWALAIFGALLVAILFALASFSYHKLIDARIRKKLFSAPDRINHLDTLFEGKKIYINELAYPFMPIVRNKVFQHCDLVGPANILFSGNTHVNGCNGELNQAALVDLKHLPIPYNTIIFVDCTIRNCNLYQTTMFVPVADYERFNAGWSRLPWITTHP